MAKLRRLRRRRKNTFPSDLIARLYNQGLKQSVIARKLNITPAVVSRSVKKLKNERLIFHPACKNAKILIEKIHDQIRDFSVHEKVVMYTK